MQAVGDANVEVATTLAAADATQAFLGQAGAQLGADYEQAQADGWSPASVAQYEGSLDLFGEAVIDDDKANANSNVANNHQFDATQQVNGAMEGYRQEASERVQKRLQEGNEGVLGDGSQVSGGTEVFAPPELGAKPDGSGLLYNPTREKNVREDASTDNLNDTGNSDVAKPGSSGEKDEVEPPLAKRDISIYNSEEAAFREAILSGEQLLTIIPEKQALHMVDSKDYIPGRSQIYGDFKDIQQLIHKYAGTGDFFPTKRNMFEKKETVKADHPVGIAVDLKGNAIETVFFKIHYRKTGTHIVPTSGKIRQE